MYQRSCALDAQTLRQSAILGALHRPQVVLLSSVGEVAMIATMAGKLVGGSELARAGERDGAAYFQLAWDAGRHQGGVRAALRRPAERRRGLAVVDIPPDSPWLW